MAGGSPERLQRDLTTLFQSGSAAGLTDGELLARIARATAGEAEGLFEVLVDRHGPMVLRVCRNALRDAHDADDAFQATCLVLAQRLSSIRKLDSVGSWLYGVAARVSARARVEAARRRRREGESVRLAVVSPPSDSDADGLAVQEEVLRLPDRYRSVVVLCYWEGLTHEQAAARLACPIGTVRSRVARARELLRRRLIRKGIAGEVAPMGLLPVPSSLAQEITLAAARIASSQPVSHVAAARVAGPSLYVARMMLMTKIGMIAAPSCLALVTSVGLGLGLAAQPSKRAEVDAKTQPQPAKAAAKNPTRDRPAIGNRPEPKKAPRIPATEAKLDEKISVDFIEQPLSDAISFIQNYSGLNITIDPKALADQGVTTSSPVTLNLRDVPLRTVLKLMLRPRGLTYVPEDDVLLITTPQEDRPRAASASKDYIVEPPDLLLVEVLEALEGRPISGERLIRPDGKITLGFYGELYVAGLTLQEVKEKIVLHLRKYLSDETLGLVDADGKAIAARDTSRVFIDVSAYNSKNYYVQGAFGAPGKLPSTGRDTVLDAVNYAGGLLPAADHSKVFLYRKAPAGGPLKKLRVDIDEVLFGADNSTNFELQPGDRLVALPKSESGQAREPADPEAINGSDGRLPNPDRLLTREEWSSLTTEQKLDALGIQVIEMRQQLKRIEERLGKP